jgi:hypothetical protein
MRHRPTPESRALVEKLAAYGVAPDIIARQVGGGLTAKGIRSYYAAELADGPAKLRIRLLDRLTALGEGADASAVRALTIALKAAGGEDIQPGDLPASAVEPAPTQTERAIGSAPNETANAPDIWPATALPLQPPSHDPNMIGEPHDSAGNGNPETQAPPLWRSPPSPRRQPLSVRIASGWDGWDA